MTPSSGSSNLSTPATGAIYCVVLQICTQYIASYFLSENFYARNCGVVCGVNCGVLPKDLECIPDAMFYWCKSLERVSIPSTVKKIGRAAFYNCQSLKEIQLPDGLQVIYENAFGKCSALQEVRIPKNTKVLDTNGQESSFENLLAFNT